MKIIDIKKTKQVSKEIPSVMYNKYVYLNFLAFVRMVLETYPIAEVSL